MSATLSIDVVIEEAGWTALDLQTLADRAGEAVAARRGLTGAFEAVLLACDDARIADLNRDFRDKPQPTNVLSWPSDERAAATPGTHPAAPAPDPFDETTELGDMAIALGVCTREAREQGKPLDHHVTHLLVYGLLHLLGYDHINDADGDLMEAEETAILATLGVPDPY